MDSQLWCFLNVNPLNLAKQLDMRKDRIFESSISFSNKQDKCRLEWHLLLNSISQSRKQHQTSQVMSWKNCCCAISSLGEKYPSGLASNWSNNKQALIFGCAIRNIFFMFSFMYYSGDWIMLRHIARISPI